MRTMRPMSSDAVVVDLAQDAAGADCVAGCAGAGDRCSCSSSPPFAGMVAVPMSLSSVSPEIALAVPGQYLIDKYLYSQILYSSADQSDQPRRPTMTSTTSTATLPKVGTYAIDPAHTEVGFVARHLVGTKVRGRFTDVAGTFTVAEKPEDSTLEADRPGRQHPHRPGRSATSTCAPTTSWTSPTTRR